MFTPLNFAEANYLTGVAIPLFIMVYFIITLYFITKKQIKIDFTKIRKNDKILKQK